MKLNKFITLLLIIIIIVFLTNFFYKKYFKKEVILPYKTVKLDQRNIQQTIDSTGTLEIKDTLKIGSLIQGTVKKIFVKENDKVSKGQLLALIDNGKDDSDVLRAKGDLQNIEAQLIYQEKYFARQQELFKANQISQDFFEQVIKDLDQLKANKLSAQATLKKYEIEYNNTKITAPEDGIVISVGITEGEAVTVDLDATVLFKIAKDLTKMEAELYIDESEIGLVAKNQEVKFNVSTYPDKTFKGIITDVSFSPVRVGGVLAYKAYLSVENKDMLLRPGMTVNAEIRIAKVKNCLAINSQAFQISHKLIEAIAKTSKYKIEKADKNLIKTLDAKCTKTDCVKSVWVVKDKAFIETPTIIGITDNIYYEIKSGLTEADKIIIDVEETDEMSKLYSKMFESAV